MVELLTQPPPMEAIARMIAIEGVRVAPTIARHAAGARPPPRPRSGRRGAHPAGDVRRRGACGRVLADGRRADGEAGDGARVHPSLQLHRRTALHADRVLAHGRRRPRVLLERRAPGGDARPVRAPLAVQPLRRALGDDARHASASSSASTATASRPRPPARAAAAAPSCSTPSRRRAMSTAERDAFLESTLAEQIRAERRRHNGDVSAAALDVVAPRPRHVVRRRCALPQRLARRARRVRLARGDVHRRATTTTSSSSPPMRDGDLAYTVGIERYRASTASGATVQNTLRVDARLPARGRRLEDRPSTRRPHARRRRAVERPMIQLLRAAGCSGGRSRA